MFFSKNKSFPDLEPSIIIGHALCVEMVLRKKTFHSEFKYDRLMSYSSPDEPDSFSIKASSRGEYLFESETTFEFVNNKWVQTGHIFLSLSSVQSGLVKYLLVPLNDDSFAIQQSFLQGTINLPKFIHGKSWSDSTIIDIHAHHALLSMQKFP